jgi:CRISPR-associated endonuclease Cas1
MQQHGSRPTPRDPSGVYCATGYGIRIRVDRGHLVVDDGVGRHRSHARFNRATSRLRRLIIVGSTGYVSIDAVRWMADTRCALTQLDHTGRLIATSAVVGNDQPSLRRAQARACDQAIGITISRWLLEAKLGGQHAVATMLDVDAAERIADRLLALEACKRLQDLRLVEAQAAAAYWAAWRGVRGAFIARDAGRVPEHWLRFSRRISPLTGSPRGAVDPANALLNYMYALLEAETRIALTTVGLDPGMGILHTDQPVRDSLALDVMEAVRPAVDRYVLGHLESQPLRAADFHEARSGQCQLMPALARQLAATAPSWAREVAPYAERAAALLALDAGTAPPPTPLTGLRRRSARPAAQRTRLAPAPKPPSPAALCRSCGEEILAGRRRCRTCHSAANAARLAGHQAVETERRHQADDYPSSRSAVRESISARQREQWRNRSATPPAGGYTGRPSEFRRLILPHLTHARPVDLARATGLSRGYCAQIRSGKRVPHVRHWAELHLAGLRRSRSGESG